MKVRRGFVHVQHHVEHMEMGIPLLKALCVLNQSLRCPLAALRTAAAVIQIADLEDGLMEQLLLLALPDMLVVVWDLIPCLFLPGVVCLQCLVEDLMVPSPVSNSVSWHPARQIEIVNIHAKTKAIFFIVAPPFLLILTE